MIVVIEQHQVTAKTREASAARLVKNEEISIKVETLKMLCLK